ncbi:hypothetical protein NEMIN01_1341 [Nematocida minor]|uniref:uncharacterized protein n=1 Tax=Nematocida minor TaxID=1912983 RepID=UPI002220F9A0|nr:uncharacterized protein NEMIN01_1341 [Nematocida minor]KAI5191072.1 hypothetical protein NEMIN01_1341 [Nematocida minor]
MLLSREYVIAAIRTLQPTYDSLSALVEYIVLFPIELQIITDIVLHESKTSNAYTNLFILYLLNELLNKQTKSADVFSQNPSAKETIKLTLKEVLRVGKQKVEQMKNTSTNAFKKSAEQLSIKYDEIEKLVFKDKDTKREEIAEKPAEKSADPAETYLDIEYLESLCKKKDKKKILKYIKELKKIV